MPKESVRTLSWSVVLSREDNEGFGGPPIKTIGTDQSMAHGTRLHASMVDDEAGVSGILEEDEQ